MKKEMNGDFRKEIIKILRKCHGEGLTITDIVKTSGFSRSAIRTSLAKLEGAQIVSVKRIGMAKVYCYEKDASNGKKIKGVKK